MYLRTYIIYTCIWSPGIPPVLRLASAWINVLKIHEHQTNRIIKSFRALFVFALSWFCCTSHMNRVNTVGSAPRQVGESKPANLSGFMPSGEDLLFEEELLRTPDSVQLWARYLEARKEPDCPRRRLIFERAVRTLPGSYKVFLSLPVSRIICALPNLLASVHIVVACLSKRTLWSYARSLYNQSGVRLLEQHVWEGPRNIVQDAEGLGTLPGYLGKTTEHHQSETYVW